MAFGILMGMSTPGRYICLSGGEGSGKTTVIERLRLELPTAVFVREPGGTPFGLTMRETLLARQYASNPWTELMLFMADRIELAERIIKPALAKGKTVISDRCWIETLVYQVLTKIGRQSVPLYLDLIGRTGCPRPDLWLWLDLDPVVGLQRRQSSGEVNNFDRDALELHQQYRQHFAEVADLVPAMRSVRIDAAESKDEVYAAVRSAIMESQ